MKEVTDIEAKAEADAGSVRIVIPLEITVRIGDSGAAVSDVSAGSLSTSRPAPLIAKPGSPEAAAAAVRRHIQSNPNVVGIRATYLFHDGELSDEKGVVIKVRPEASRDPNDYGLEPSIGSIPVSIEMADLESLARALVPEEALEAPAKMQAYKRDLSDPKFKLEPINDDMTLTLHVSPEAGWRELSKFFDGDDYDRITIGMYNFTAPHIIEAIQNAIEPHNRQMTLTLDRKSDDIGGGTKKDDWPEEKVMQTLKHDAGDRFKFTPASVSGPGRLFATSYHIKVAVLSGRSEGARGGALRDKRFWLSSGNWASSNQAPLDDRDHPLDGLTWVDVRNYDRDWHAIVANEKLARVFRNHLEQDFADCEAQAGEEAAAPIFPDLIVPEDYFLEAPRTMRNYKPFPPKVINQRVKVQPILTPDNYPDVVLPLIKGATESVLFINQSFDIKEDETQIPEHYKRLLDALLDRQKKIPDVRIIFRSGFGKERDVFRNAVEFGFDKKRIKFFGTCHTKGIVVDKKRVLLGSQNWTGAGTKPNRDASLLIDNEEAAKYFADIFEFDWANVATGRVPPDHGPTRRAHAASGDQEAVIPAGFRVVPWGAWSGS
jgi:PLD-like domain